MRSCIVCEEFSSSFSTVDLISFAASSSRFLTSSFVYMDCGKRRW